MRFLEPASHKLAKSSWGWLIPTVLLFIVSFPPLFGHEVIAILLGIVYPWWPAFGINALGTLLGEVGNYYAFRSWLSPIARKMERGSLDYACLAHIVRVGGFKIALMARMSAIPGHFTTAIFATIGMRISTFLAAAILTLPKQAAIVYVGVIIKQSGYDHETTKDKVIKYCVLLGTGIVTVVAALCENLP